MTTYVHSYWMFSEKELFQIKLVEKIQTHIFMLNKCFRKPCRSWDNVKKYDTAREETDDYIIRRRKMRFACRITKNTYTYAHILIIFNPYCSAADKVVTRTRFRITLYVHTLVFRRHVTSQHIIAVTMKENINSERRQKGYITNRHGKGSYSRLHLSRMQVNGTACYGRSNGMIRQHSRHGREN